MALFSSSAAGRLLWRGRVQEEGEEEEEVVYVTCAGAVTLRLPPPSTSILSLRTFSVYGVVYLLH